jgi:hypothetical protein
MAKNPATLRGVQWPLVAGGGVLGTDLLDTDMEITQLPGGAILNNVDLLITEAFDGTTPTVAVVMTEMDGTGEVELVAPQSGVNVIRTNTALTTQAQLLTPRRVFMRGVAADATAGAAWAGIQYTVPGRSNEVSD